MSGMKPVRKELAPSYKAAMKKDILQDKKKGIKQNSPLDKKLDAKVKARFKK